MNIEMTNEDLTEAVEAWVGERFPTFEIALVEFIRAPLKSGGVRASVTMAWAGDGE